ncbi:neuronal pentraxin-1 [Puntigrus tetrazona]|uniref:neuronal pentraxin-1 n=1 Tax=Puntigrus tetrazona TaxID=1606681 RepID=UPI001C8A5623|nr:neuronal pentraxin-1 [Puntigrus tetrazona]XP_043116359.1 neuronal pentraxin-1 [Puntigrus tetrazona]
MHPASSRKSEGLFSFFFCAICLAVSAGTGMPGSDYNPHPRFICTPIPADADPGCFPSAGGPGGPGGPGHHGGNSNGWWGMSEEAKATILHLRESLVQQKETILDQRETIRDLTAKLNLCEGLSRTPAQLAHHAHHAYPTAPHAGPLGLELGHYGDVVGGHHAGKGALSEKHVTEEVPSPSSTPEQMSKMLQSLKQRLDNLQTRNTSSSYSSSLKDLLQRKIGALEQQMQHHHSTHSDHEEDEVGHHGDDHHDDRDHDDSHSDHADPHDESHHADHHDDDHHGDDHHDDDDDHHGDEHHDGNHHGDDRYDGDRYDGDHHGDDRHDDSHHDDNSHDNGHHDNEASEHGSARLSYNLQGHREAQGAGAHSKLDAVLSQLQHRLTDTGSRKKSKEAFQIGFPMRTNYMYGRVKRTLLHEIFSFTLCLWMKAGIAPGLGTPFSYSVPGQANELVLIEWGNNPMELLVDDRAVTLPLSVSDGKWHHVCVTWSTRDGLWEAYQDGVKRGSGENLSPWHPIKPGGVFILGQEQDTLGGRFDATQAFVGEVSDVQMWSHVLTPHDIYSLASCGGHMTGDIIAWAESVVELHGGVTKYPFDPCH